MLVFVDLEIQQLVCVNLVYSLPCILPPTNLELNKSYSRVLDALTNADMPTKNKYEAVEYDSRV